MYRKVHRKSQKCVIAKNLTRVFMRLKEAEVRFLKLLFDVSEGVTYLTVSASTDPLTF